MFSIFRKIRPGPGLFNGHFIDAKVLYIEVFDEIPCITFVGELDITKVYEYIQYDYSFIIDNVYQHSFFNHADGNVYFNNTIIVMNGMRMIELGNDYCHVMHPFSNYTWGRKMAAKIAEFRIVKNGITAIKHVHVTGFAKDSVMN